MTLRLRATNAATGPHRQFDRIPALDGVRGIAIIAVMFVHFGFYTSTAATTVLDRVVLKVTGTGWIGVDLFFVLSGFLITGILYDAKSGQGYFRNFYARRCLRIFPAYYVFLLLLFFIVPLVRPMETIANASVAQDRLWLVSYLTNVKMASAGWRHAQPLTGHLWSLAVEEQFYLVWPAFVLLLNRRQMMAACLVAVCSAIIIRWVIGPADIFNRHPWANDLLPARMDELAIGGLIALALRDPVDFQVLSRWLPRVAIGAAGLLIGVSVLHGQLMFAETWTNAVGLTALALVFGAFVLAAATARQGGRIESALRFPALTTLGRYSYAMYLVHLPIAYLLFRSSHLGGSIPQLAGSHLPGVLVFYGAAFALTLATAWISWQVLESQFLKLKVLFPYASKRIATQLSGGPVPSPVQGGL